MKTASEDMISIDIKHTLNNSIKPTRRIDIQGVKETEKTLNYNNIFLTDEKSLSYLYSIASFPWKIFRRVVCFSFTISDIYS